MELKLQAVWNILMNLASYTHKKLDDERNRATHIGHATHTHASWSFNDRKYRDALVIHVEVRGFKICVQTMINISCFVYEALWWEFLL